MGMTRKAVCLAVATSCLFPSGCKQSPPKQQSSVIPVKVWVVFASLPGESLGNRNNRGSRLTMAEIKWYIDALNNNAHIYGVQVKFQPITDAGGNPILTIVNDPSIPVFGNRRVDPQVFAQNVILAGNWSPNVYNVYFTGFVSPPTPINGATVDPQQSSVPHTFINDGGNENNGVVVVDPARLTLEHEATHFLLRRDQQGPPYDSNQHVPAGSNNILVPSPPTPLFIPRGPGSEQEEIANRIKNGLVF